jgi:DNA helicase-2/ATP-dependent DNA helicase PcrA
MTEQGLSSPALVAARAADEQVLQCLAANQSFLLEAGAGAGKTYSLIEVLRHLIATQGPTIRRRNQRIACITYTNVATAVINNRIDGNPLVLTDTIHAFCWSLIKGFQPALRKGVAGLQAWQDRLAESGPIGNRRIDYDLGHRRITDELVSLHHDDVLMLMIELLPLEKFQTFVAGKYPFILIDEYQDTNLGVMDAIKTHLLGRIGGPLIGLFGDHWQRIYDKTCGHVDHAALKEISKGSNFRSSTAVVNVLNAMRPELPQAIKDESFVGSAVVYHTNSWKGTRRPGTGGGHWKGDLPADIAHQYLENLIAKLKGEGWDFAPDKTKVLMLTHNVLASEQGYSNLSAVFPYSELFIKKEDEHIAFFADKLEPACDAFGRRRYGEMFEVLGDAAPRFASHAEKMQWSKAMAELVALRSTGSVGDVIDHIREQGHPLLPDSVLRREDLARNWKGEEGEEMPEGVRRCRQLREIAYREMIALDQYIDGHTPFATKHSVKGDEFENVLIVLGRGWNRYNFEQLLEWAGTPSKIPGDKRETFERNQNLFYVCCSRPTTRLALLFTQLLSNEALQTLRGWFGASAISEFTP